MSDNARELLKEARVYVNGMEVEYQHRNEDGYYEEDLRRAVDLKGRIDAHLTAPSESAMETVRKIREFIDCNGKASGRTIMRLHLTATESAALIEDYAERETAALRDLVRKMRIAGNMVRDAMPNSVAVHNWIDVCAEADKVLWETTP